MKTLRTKFILTFLALTVLPATAIAILTKSLLDKTFSLGVNPEVANGWRAAMAALQQNYAHEREQLSSDLRRLAMGLRRKPATAFTASDSSHTFVLLDSAGHVLATWPPQVAFDIVKPLPHEMAFADSMRDAGSDSTALRLGVAVKPGMMVIGKHSFSAALRRQAADIMRASQYFNLIDLEQARLRRSLWLVFLVVYMPMLLLALLAGWYFARRITAPLAGLAAGARRLAQGDWQQRVAAGSRDEIGELARAFNAMVQDLQQQQEKLIGLEKLAAWREMARVLAHEIKNPLTPIQLMVQQMQDEYRGENHQYQEMLAECGSIITAEIEKLRRLAREFSEFARMPELHMAPGQLNELLQEVARLYAARAPRLDLDPALPQFNFDREALRRVLINLIENALQSAPTTEVKLSTVQPAARDSIALRIADNGPGIPPQDLKKIFEPYFSTKKTGMGLGLAIVRRIIEEHQGSIAVTSEVGKGTQVLISLTVAGKS